MDEEYDNDYAENYFDNGEGDDNDDLGGGGGGDEGGGGTYHPFLPLFDCGLKLARSQQATTTIELRPCPLYNLYAYCTTAISASRAISILEVP